MTDIIQKGSTLIIKKLASLLVTKSEHAGDPLLAGGFSLAVSAPTAIQYPNPHAG